MFDALRDFLSKFWQMLKDVLALLFRGAKNGFSGSKSNWFGLKNLFSWFNVGFNKISGYLHVPTKVVAGSLIVAILVGGGSAIVAFRNNSYVNFMAEQEFYEDTCVEELDDMLSGYNIDVDINQMKLETAEKVWGVFKYLGLTDEMAAGALSNMEAESSVDPTTIEGIYDEHFNPDGPKHMIIRNTPNGHGLCEWFMNQLVPHTYAEWSVPPAEASPSCRVSGHPGGKELHTDGYISKIGHFCPGIGLCQWTGSRGTNLQEYANAGNKDWWELDLQLAFLFDETGGDREADWLLHVWKDSAPGSPQQAAIDFALKVEGHSAEAGSDRVTRSDFWYKVFKGRSGDLDFASSVISLANSIQGGALSRAVSDKRDECGVDEAEYDNTDIARAAVSYAWKYTENGRPSGERNKGTELYVNVHDIVYQGDHLWQSCDRSVATAVRWSGADDDFPAGNCDGQDSYCRKSDKWMLVGRFEGNRGSDPGNSISLPTVRFEDLQPGDVLIKTHMRNTKDGVHAAEHGHTVLFVGHDIVVEKYADRESAEFVSGSYQDRSPGCEDWRHQFDGRYWVYRNVEKTTNSQWIDIAEGKNWCNGNYYSSGSYPWIPCPAGSYAGKVF